MTSLLWWRQSRPPDATEGTPLDGSQLFLTPVTATVLFVIAVIAGYRYRRVWKSEGPAWQAWLFGTIAAACLLVLGFMPLRFG